MTIAAPPHLPRPAVDGSRNRIGSTIPWRQSPRGHLLYAVADLFGPDDLPELADVRERPPLFVALGLAALLGCTGAHCEHRWGYNIPTGGEYTAAPSTTTPAGVRFDASGQAIDPATVDRLVSEVEACLSLTIDRSAFVVKVPSSWALSCDKTQELLPTAAPDSGCAAKGLTPSDACPCRWRALVQCPNVIISTPSLYLFKDALIRFVTGSHDPWADPKLAACAAPSTPPRSSSGPVGLGDPSPHSIKPRIGG